MKVSHHVATENALLKAMTMFLVTCCIFTLLVAGMSWGRYGYGPSLDFYWAPIALLVFWQWECVVEVKSNKSIIYRVVWMGYTIRTRHFETINWVKSGKLQTLHGVSKEGQTKTMFCIEADNLKQMMIDKMVGNPTIA